MAHSRFGASAAHRWMRCPGSIKASEGIPNVSSPAAEEGTMLHEVAANILLDLPVEYELTDEQWDVVNQYLDTVRSVPGKLLVEAHFKLPHHPEFWGTADAVIVGDGKLTVIDLKAGRGVAVEADYNGRVNPQLGFYALGAMSLFPDVRFREIEIVIVQPRFGGVKRRVTSVAELEDLADEMLAAATNAVSDTPRFEAGSHCKFCLARQTCHALRDEVFRLARMDFDDEFAAVAV